MLLIKKAAHLNRHLERARESGRTIAFVPTMGALHAGHLDLIRKAIDGNQLVIASIFINPTQFNDPEDYRKYPVTISADVDKLASGGCDILFLPPVDEVYPEGTKSEARYDLGYLESILEGKYRPGHFQGVAAVMDRLLTLVSPDTLYMDQKDYQQCMVVKRLIGLKQFKTDLIPCETQREADGLAMSSRNLRLSEAARKNAPEIYRALQGIQSGLKPGDLQPLIDRAEKQLKEHGFKVDYVEIADAGNLDPVRHWNGQQRLVALVAAFQDDVRLIDNLLLNNEL